MKKILLVIFLLGTSLFSSLLGQTDSLTSFLFDADGKLKHSDAYSINTDDLERWISVENEIIEHLESDIKYPQAFLDAGLMGMTITKVTVNGDKIVEISIVNSIGGGTDEELLRSINSIPSELIMILSSGKKGKTTIPLPVLFAISPYSKSNVILIQEE